MGQVSEKGLASQSVGRCIMHHFLSVTQTKTCFSALTHENTLKTENCFWRAVKNTVCMCCVDLARDIFEWNYRGSISLPIIYFPTFKSSFLRTWRLKLLHLYLQSGFAFLWIATFCYCVLCVFFCLSLPTLWALKLTSLLTVLQYCIIRGICYDLALHVIMNWSVFASYPSRIFGFALQR